MEEKQAIEMNTRLVYETMKRRPRVVQKLVERPLQWKSVNPKCDSSINNLPIEVLSKVLEYLSVSDILMCARTCRHWLEACSQNDIWRIQFRRLPARMQKQSVEAKKPTSHTDWKRETISCLKKYRRKNVELLLKRKSQYSRLPEKISEALKYLEVRWIINILDADGREHELVTKAANNYTTSISICWTDVDLPVVGRLVSCAIYAQSPLVHNEHGNVTEHSACSRSLIAKLPLKGIIFDQKNVLGSDQHISIYVLSKGLVFGLWHEDSMCNKSIGFITLNLHSLHIVERVLNGSSQCVYSLPLHQPILDDIDRKYGLERYSALIELRTIRKTLWSHKVVEFFKGQIENRYLIMTDERTEYQNCFDIHNPIRLPWKAGAIKGVIKNIAVLDFSLIDCNGDYIWNASEVIKAISAETTDVNFESRGGENRTIVLNDEQKGWLKLSIAVDADSDCCAVHQIKIGLKLNFINSWFGTKH